MPARPGKLLDERTCKAHAWCLRDGCLQISIQSTLVVNGTSSHGDERDERERDCLEVQRDRQVSRACAKRPGGRGCEAENEKDRRQHTALVRRAAGSHVEARDVAGMAVLESLWAGGDRERSAAFHLTRYTGWRTSSVRGRGGGRGRRRKGLRRWRIARSR